MTPAFKQGFMDKLAAIKSPEDLDAFYKKLKYRVLNKDTNRPYFNTNFETFDHWHLLSPEQIKKHKIGICWDTAAMTDKVLSDLGVEHANYFAHSKDLSKATHSFNVYKDKDGNWRWIEGAWKPYKGNDWKERRKKDLVKRIVRALEEAGGDKQIIHSVDKFPEPGVGDKEFYEEMLKHPIKRAEYIKAAAKDYGGMDYGRGYVPTYEEKQDLKEVGGKLVPKTQEERNADARRWTADAVRGGALPLTLVPGVGLAGAAGIIGAGETAASGIEGRSLGESVDRGTTAGVLTYGGGKALQKVFPYVRAAYRFATKGGLRNAVSGRSFGHVANSTYDGPMYYTDTDMAVNGAVSRAKERLFEAERKGLVDVLPEGSLTVTPGSPAPRVFVEDIQKNLADIIEKRVGRRIAEKFRSIPLRNIHGQSIKKKNYATWDGSLSWSDRRPKDIALEFVAGRKGSVQAAPHIAEHETGHSFNLRKMLADFDLNGQTLAVRSDTAKNLLSGRDTSKFLVDDINFLREAGKASPVLRSEYMANSRVWGDVSKWPAERRAAFGTYVVDAVRNGVLLDDLPVTQQLKTVYDVIGRDRVPLPK